MEYLLAEMLQQIMWLYKFCIDTKENEVSK